MIGQKVSRYITALCHMMAGVVFICFCIAFGALGGAMSRGGHWPYVLQDRKFLSPKVESGGDVLVARQIKYLEDCELYYLYRFQSRVEPGLYSSNPFRVYYDHPPWDLDGKLKTSTYPLPEGFPCGPAYFVESISAACTWWQRNFSSMRMRKDDVFTDFEVVGCPA